MAGNPMTPQAWYPQYIGLHIGDNHGNYVGECVSFVKRYAQEAIGIPDADSVLYVNDDKAKNAWLDSTPLQDQHFNKVNSPQNGDIAVYDGNYGDIAVYIGNGQVVGQYGTPVFTPVKVRSVNQPSVPLGYLRRKNMPSLADEDTVKRLLLAYMTEEQVAAQGGEKYVQGFVGSETNGLVQAFADSPQFLEKRQQEEAAAAGAVTSVVVNGKPYKPA